MSTTEETSNFEGLEEMTVDQILSGINQEDKTVALAVENAIPQIIPLVEQIASKMKEGGRLFYIGAGTSGRLGVVDASEIPPTYGLDHDRVIGLMAGGDDAIREAVEFAEDDAEQAWKDMLVFNINEQDVVVGIAASGRTPYVIGGIVTARQNGLVTGCITCNNGSDLAKETEYPIEAIVGPEFVTGSTRMKAGTAQKLVLNMISTAVMIKLGRVRGNKMVDMQLSNHKLWERGARMIVEETGVGLDTARKLLEEHKSVRDAVDAHRVK